MGKKNQYRSAIGLHYDADGEGAPTVGVRGERLIADEVVRIAKRFGIPVVEKPELVRALAACELEEEIPEELFEAVAILLKEVEERME